MRKTIAKLTLISVLCAVFSTGAVAETVDFDEFATDAVVNVISTTRGTIDVFGTNPTGDSSINYARIFDSSNPTCSDSDLETADLDKVLIIQEAQEASMCSPNDIGEDVNGAIIRFDFNFGPVTVGSMSFLDIDGVGQNRLNPRIELFDENDVSLGVFAIPMTANNGRVTVAINTANVSRMDVWLQGSGAITGFEYTTDEPPTGSLGDTVWNDVNGDGLFEDGVESGVDGVTVYLGTPDANATGGCAYDPTDVADTTTTMNGGKYLFGGLNAGDYCVVFEKPPGFTCTTPNVDDPNSDAIDSDGASFGDICVTGTVSLDQGEDDLSVDLGLVALGPAFLGDRVWEDLNGNGVQDCIDGGAANPDGVPDGVIGNAGDTGPECGAGVEGVLVELFENCGSATETFVTSAITKTGGIYGFDINGFAGSESRNFCVKVNSESAEAALGCADPYFTKQNQGTATEATDSDIDVNGQSDSVELGAGGKNLTVDAGLVCPAVIGDYVWLDADNLGISDDAGDVPFTAADVTVILRSCAEPNEPVATTTTDGGFYQFVSGPSGTGGFDLSADPNGCFYVQFDEPDGYDFTVLGEGNVANDSNCSADDPRNAGEVFVVSGTDNQTLDCGLVPEPLGCGLDLTKRCYVQPQAEVPFTGDCKGKLQQFTVIWNGANGVSVTDDVRNDSDGDISNGEAVTFFAPDGGFSDNDVFVTIDGVGESVFHMSCSDDLFDGPEDCGLPAGNGKGDDDSKGLNSWLFGGFVDAEGKTLVCPALMAPSEVPDSAFAAECPFTAPIPPSCDTIDKPELLTWRYDGGSCADSTFAGLQGDDFLCEEGVDLDPTAAIAVYDDQDGDNVVMPGKEFTISRDASKKLLLQQNSADVQYLEAHMSCSQPIAVGATAGALTLVALDGQRGDVDVLYRFDVKNTGDAVNNVMFKDPLLGFETNLGTLDTGYSDSFDLMASISGTTENTATIEGLSVFGALCSDSATATAEAIIPPCDVSIKIDDVTDDALKLKLTNNDSRNRVATLEKVVITYPDLRGPIKEVKLDGAIYKRDDSDADLVSTATIGLDDWTEGDVTKRQLDPGEERTLEIKTFEKTDKEEAEFTVTLKFAEGCEYTFTATKADKGTVLSF